MEDLGSDAPDWEILKLLREVRRRVRQGNPQRFLEHLSAEPRWVAALPPEEAKVARTMLEATRELARRAISPADVVEAEIEIQAPALPRRSRKQERRNLALAREADRMATQQELALAAPRRRRRRG